MYNKMQYRVFVANFLVQCCEATCVVHPGAGTIIITCTICAFQKTNALDNPRTPLELSRLSRLEHCIKLDNERIVVNEVP